MRRVAVVAVGGLLVCTLAGCSPPQGVDIHNGLDVTVDVWVEEPGRAPSITMGNLAPGLTSGYQGTLLSGDAKCESSKRLVAVTPAGKRYTYGPPLCRMSRWNIGEGGVTSCPFRGGV